MFSNKKKEITKLTFAILLSSMVFILCVIGYFNVSPINSISVIWPVNAFLMGGFVRFPFLRNYYSYVLCSVSYGLYNFVFFDDLTKIVCFFFGDFFSITSGVFLFSMLSDSNRKLLTPNSVFIMFGIILVSSSCFSFFVWIFRGEFIVGFATDMINYAALLPFIITLPKSSEFVGGVFGYFYGEVRVVWNGGGVLIFFSILLGHFFGADGVSSIGVIAFPLLGLLWFSLRCKVFFVSFLSLCYSYFLLFFLSHGVGGGIDFISVRMAMSVICLSPLTVACVIYNRDNIINSLAFDSTHDSMTAVLNRKKFFELSCKKLDFCKSHNQSFTVMMLDLDFFKSINDRFGHAAGDSVIIELSKIIKRNVRENDLVGRLGGEEFGIVISGCEELAVFDIASEIKNSFHSHPFVFDGCTVSCTVSIGVVFCIDHTNLNFNHAISSADSKLYEAKNAGRNLIVMGGV